MHGGFKESPLRLNEGLGAVEFWNEATIRDRAERLATRASQVWAALVQYRAPIFDNSLYTLGTTLVGVERDSVGEVVEELVGAQGRDGVRRDRRATRYLRHALAQFLVMRKWQRALLVVGQTDDDRAYAAALRRAMKRFGMQLVAEKAWTFDNDQRRSAQADMPLFTQTAEYDVVLVADERGDFGEYLPYQTWYPRPVAGTQGLTPTGWHKTVETFGAAQLQKRFEAQAGRWMNDRDFAAWMAVRSVASAVSKLRQAEPRALQQLLLSEQLPLDGFKGRKLSYRPWNGELRQPIPLVQPRALVSTSPQEGFLHPFNEMDSLGYDRPEVTCGYP